MIFKDICTTYYSYRCVIYEACVLEKFDSPVKYEGNLLATKAFQPRVGECLDRCKETQSCESFKYCPKHLLCYLPIFQL